MNSVEQQVADFFAAFPKRQFDSGQTIIQPFEQAERIFYIESGRVRQYAITNSGDEVVLNIFENPAFIPMVWALNDADNQYVFSALSDVTVRVAPKQAALKFIKEQPEVAFDLLKRVSSGLDGVMLRMVHLMSSSAYVRILHELVIQVKRAKQPGTSIVLPIKEYELANICGLSKETVSRQFAQLKKLRLVSVTSEGIAVKDTKKLLAELDAQL